MATKVNQGPISGNVFCRDYPVAASQKFHPLGGKLVFLDSSGHVTLALTATATLFGLAVGKGSLGYDNTDATNGYYTSNATAGADKITVYPFAANPGMVFKMITTAAGGLAVAARVGETADIVGVNDGTAQYATPATTVTDVLLVVALEDDGDTNSAYFAVNPAKIQADT